MRERNIAHGRQHQFALVGKKTIVPGRQHTCRGWRRRNGERGRMADPRQFAAQAALEYRPAAEQTQARTDFDQQPIGCAQADMAAEAVGPGGKAAQQTFFGLWVTSSRKQWRIHGTRRCRRLTQVHASLPCLRIDEDNVLALARPIDQGAGLYQFAIIEDSAQWQIEKMQAGPKHVTAVMDGQTSA